VPVLVASSQVRASEADAAQGRLVAALDAANGAVRAEPWSASAYLQRALVLEQVGQLASANGAAQHAIRLEPTNWQLWLVLGRIEAERGQVRPALAAVEKARTLSPRAPIFQRGVARHLAGPPPGPPSPSRSR
jgi:tetratricopeptide (TPR) repeat protein